MPLPSMQPLLANVLPSVESEYIVSDSKRHALAGPVKSLIFDSVFYYKIEFDRLGRRTLSYQKSGDTWRYFYGDSGKLIKITCGDERFGAPLEVKTFIFNYVGNVGTALYKSPSSNLEVKITVNLNGQIISRQTKSTTSYIENYTYDKQGYMINDTIVEGFSEYSPKYKDYVYDRYGNWTYRTPIDPKLGIYTERRTIEYWN